MGVQRRQKDLNPKYCQVCGSPTNCLHYGVLSCRSCKFFFRRCYLLKLNYVCKFSSQCNILEGSDCKACKYQKCLDLGMDPSSIEVQTKRSVPYLANKPDDFHLIPELVLLEKRLKELRLSHYKPEMSCNVTTYDIVASSSNLGSKEIRPVYFSAKDDPETRVKTYCKALRYRDAAKYWPLVDLVLNIEMAKTIPLFQELGIYDKVELLKNVTYINVLLTEAYYSYTQLHSTICNPDGTLPILIRTKHWMPFGLPDAAYSRLLDPFYRINPTFDEYILLKTLLYFYYLPASNLSKEAQEKLHKEYTKISKLLFKHMQIQHGKDEGTKKFADLMGLVGTLYKIFERHKEIYIFEKMSKAKNKLLEEDRPNWAMLMDEIFA